MYRCNNFGPSSHHVAWRPSHAQPGHVAQEGACSIVCRASATCGVRAHLGRHGGQGEVHGQAHQLQEHGHRNNRGDPKTLDFKKGLQGLRTSYFPRLQEGTSRDFQEHRISQDFKKGLEHTELIDHFPLLEGLLQECSSAVYSQALIGAMCG